MNIIWLILFTVFSLYPINKANNQCPTNCVCENLSVTCKNGFKNLNNLKKFTTINLPGLNLENIKTDCKLKNVEYLNLSNNLNIKLDSGSFCGMVNLQILNLNNCQLKHIDKSWMNNINHIKKLEINSNRLASLPKFSPMSSLEELDLSNNRITFLNELIFELNSFKKLKLNSNSLTSIDSKAFYDSSINYIDLSNNNLQSIPKFGWDGKDLIELIMDNNNIVTIHSWSFEGMINLQRLSMKNCKIKYIQQSIFNILNVEYFDLTNNHLKYIEGNLNTINKLILNNNQWNCDCKMRNIKEIINNNTKSFCNNDNSSNCIICKSPNEYKNKYIGNVPLEDCSSSILMSSTEKILTIVIPLFFIVVIFFLLIYLYVRLKLERKDNPGKKKKPIKNGVKHDTEPVEHSTPSPFHNPKSNLQRRLSRSVEDLRLGLQEGHVNEFMRKGSSVDELRLFGPILASGGTSTGVNSLNASQKDISLKLNTTGVETIV